MPRISLGDVYLIPTPPNGSHFYVAIAELDNGSYLFVNYSTVQDSTADEDLAYTLSPTRTLARFLNRESYFVFGRAQEFSSSDLELLMRDAGCEHKGAFPQSIVEQIQYAGVASNSTKKKYKKLLKNLLGL